jgi:hypothetical protein
MKLKWLWKAWAHLAVLCLIALELISVTYSVVFLIPKMQKMKVDGMFWEGDYTKDTLAWAFSFLKSLQWFWESQMQWVLLGLVVLWGLFEWRVRSESKPFIRLAALATSAIGLTVLLVFTAASLILPFFMALAPPSRVAISRAIRQIASVDGAIARLDNAAASLDKTTADADWTILGFNADAASNALQGMAATALPPLEETPEEERPAFALFNGQLKWAQVCLLEAQQAIQHKDAERLKKAMRQFHEVYDRVGRRQ